MDGQAASSQGSQGNDPPANGKLCSTLATNRDGARRKPDALKMLAAALSSETSSTRSDRRAACPPSPWGPRDRYNPSRTAILSSVLGRCSRAPLSSATPSAAAGYPAVCRPARGPKLHVQSCRQVRSETWPIRPWITTIMELDRRCVRCWTGVVDKSLQG